MDQRMAAHRDDRAAVTRELLADLARLCRKRGVPVRPEVRAEIRRLVYRGEDAARVE